MAQNCLESLVFDYSYYCKNYGDFDDADGDDDDAYRGNY